MTLTQTHLELLKRACEIRERAYAPYSAFKVGAAVRSVDGRIFCGCNVENASYGLSICAERVALFNAVSAGVTAISQLAICTDVPNPTTPCGACRQVLAEFGISVEIVTGNPSGSAIAMTLEELFPQPFRLAHES